MKIQKRDVGIFKSHVGVEGVVAFLHVLDHRSDGIREVVAKADTACLTFLLE